MFECIKRAIMIVMAGLLLAGPSYSALAEEKENMSEDMSEHMLNENVEFSIKSDDLEESHSGESEFVPGVHSRIEQTESNGVVIISDEKVGLASRIEGDGQTLGVPGTVLYKIQDYTGATVKTLILVGLTVIGSALVGALHAVKMKKTLPQNNKEDE